MYSFVYTDISMALVKDVDMDKWSILFLSRVVSVWLASAHYNEPPNFAIHSDEVMFKYFRHISLKQK